MRKWNLVAIVLIAILPLLAFFPQGNLQYLQVNMLARTLQGKQYVKVNSTLYFDIVKQTMVTHAISPIDQVAINYVNGDMKVYNSKQNTYVSLNNMDLSSKNSFLYNFIYGATGDLGLKQNGYKISETKKDKDGILVTTWVPIEKRSKGILKIILAQEKNLPIYMSFTNEKKFTTLKIYYDNYVKVSSIMLPSTMTEIEFTSKTDSVITQRNFSEFKTNAACDKSYINFSIPSSAKRLETAQKK
jgi:hypothetical protein